MAPLSLQAEAILAHLSDGGHEGVAHWPAHQGKPHQLVFVGGSGPVFVALHPEALATDLAVLVRARLLVPATTVGFVTEDEFFTDDVKTQETVYALTAAGKTMVAFVRWGEADEQTPFWSRPQPQEKGDPRVA